MRSDVVHRHFVCMCRTHLDLCVNNVFVCLFVVSLFAAVRQQLGHGDVPLPEPGPEPGDPVGPGVKEKYSQNTLAAFLFKLWAVWKISPW